MVISGSKFGPSIGTLEVGSSTIDSAAISSWSDTSITFDAPPGVGVNIPVVVSRTAASCGSISSNPPGILHYAAPSISFLDPDTGPIEGGTVLTITGSDFGIDPPFVTLGGVSLGNLISNNQTTIEALLPAGCGTQLEVTVTTASGFSAPAFFDYLEPEILQINPPGGPSSGGTILTIGGANFGDSPGSVTLGGSLFSVISWTSTSIEAITNSGTGTDVPLVVETICGSTASGSFS